MECPTPRKSEGIAWVGVVELISRLAMGGGVTTVTVTLCWVELLAFVAIKV
jgi:hypothetical protein